MFTGLVADLGTVISVDASDAGVRLTVRTALELREGDSVAVNGVCLTATSLPDGAFTADVMQETLRRSSLGALDEGSKVNLELPLRADDRLGGHFVQGHVDGLGTVRDVREEGFSQVATIAAPPELMRYVIEADDVAKAVVSAVEKGKSEVTVPWFPYRLATIGQALVPGIFSRLVTRRAGQHRDE